MEMTDVEFEAQAVVDMLPGALSHMVTGDTFYGLELIRRVLEEAGYRAEARTIAELQRGVA
jgi:hypothetical protein